MRDWQRSLGVLLAATLMALAAATVAGAAADEGAASDPPTEKTDARKEPAKPSSTGEGLPRLPAPSVTKHSVALEGRTLSFTVAVEAIPLRNDKGAVVAEAAVIAYKLDGQTAAKRPVTFAINGGPGSASAWLHLGLLGPWRLPFSSEGVSPSAPALLAPNGDTWLDFTDLVFIDPVGTGFSRIVAEEEESAKKFYSVSGDVDSIAAVIQQWLVKHGRVISPKYYVGESYSGFRGPKIIRKLQTDLGAGISGAVLVSPVLDFSLMDSNRQNVLRWMADLPSMAAVTLESKGSVTERELQEAEAYAAGEYVVDLLRGERDGAALDRMSKRVAHYTGFDAAFVRRLAGRVDAPTFLRERNRDKGLIGSYYDGSALGLDPWPHVHHPPHVSDPFTKALTAPVTSAILDLYGKFNWLPDRPYELGADTVNARWNWEQRRSSNQALSELQEALALDPELKVLVVHGYGDLVTPYFGSKIMLNQLAPVGKPDRLRLVVYPGGHMFYSRDASRAALRQEASEMMKPKGR